MKHVGGAKPILYVAMIVVLLSTFLVVATPVTAQADTGIHWQGWWAGDHVINSATVGQTVTAKVRLVGYPAGDYRIRIRRDRSDLRLDVDIATDEFYYDGGDHTYSMDFVPATATGVDWTEGYHVDVYIDVVLWGWAELWTLDNAYPPRLQVHDANRIVWPAIGSPAIQTKGSTLTIEVAEDDDLSTDKAQWTATIKKGHRNIEVTKDPTTDAETTTDNGTDYYLEYVLEVTDVARLSSAGGNG